MLSCELLALQRLAVRLQRPILVGRSASTAVTRSARLLSLDVGERYIGVAISDGTNSLASALRVIERKRTEPVAGAGSGVGTGGSGPVVTARMARETLSLLRRQSRGGFASARVDASGAVPHRTVTLPFDDCNAQLRALIDEHAIAGVVIGVPNRMRYAEQWRATHRFVHALLSPAATAAAATATTAAAASGVGALRVLCERIIRSESTPAASAGSAFAGAAAAAASATAVPSPALPPTWNGSQLLSHSSAVQSIVFGWSEDFSSLDADRFLSDTGRLGRLGGGDRIERVHASASTSAGAAGSGAAKQSVVSVPKHTALYRAAQKSAGIDAHAARIVLQRFLDHLNKTTASPKL